MVATGLDRWVADGFESIRGKSVGVVCNQASLASDDRHILDHLIPFHQSGALRVAGAFGPQHGIWGQQQDNMIEWEGYEDPRTGFRFHSLYGAHRKPTPAMLQGVEHLVFDVPEVGARYYTFLWTLALCLEACAELGVPVTVLDRPNPIGGEIAEGGVNEPDYLSFVGWHPLPARTGLTMGEVGRYVQRRFVPGVELEVVQSEGWDRRLMLDETSFGWSMPSPNMPTVETALVYPGMCLVEGTKLSEGRGTTRPFEIVGAPWLDGWRLAESLQAERLPGVRFRPYVFQPTFQKHAGQVCQGVHLRVVDRAAFRPVLTGIAVIRAAFMQNPGAFEWLAPPYEYEEQKMPFDILAGNGWLRPAIEQGTALTEIAERLDGENRAFLDWRKVALSC